MSSSAPIEQPSTAGEFPAPGPVPWSRAVRLSIFVAVALQFVALCIVNVQSANTLNHDAIAYHRAAIYYLRGDWSLAVSGYWGPLFSWLLAPLIGAIGDPLSAGRVAMVISGQVALGAMIWSLRLLDIPGRVAALAVWCIGLHMVVWSVHHVTPDLLLTAPIGLTMAMLCASDYLDNPRRPFLAGLFAGLAYLVKAMALPWSVASVAAISAVWWFVRPEERRKTVRSAAIVLATTLAIALPWIVTISIRYGQPLFSTTAKIAHATVGPASLNPDNPRQHDIHRHHQVLIRIEPPPPGRVTSWEDPDPADYRYWSPFANEEYFQHQLHIIRTNLDFSFVMLSLFDYMRTGLGLLLLTPIVLPFTRRNVLAQRWRWTALPILILVAAYLPVYSGSYRYFLPVVPFLFVNGAGVLAFVLHRAGLRARIATTIGALVVTLSYGSQAAMGTYLVAHVPANDMLRTSVFAPALAQRLKERHLRGPIVGSAEVNGAHLGMFVAFLLEEPWYGDLLEPTPEAYRRSGASLIFVRRNSELASQLDAARWAVNLDRYLFRSPGEADASPAKIYAIRGKRLH